MGQPIVLATWLGEEPELPSVLLNGHYDVVPSEDEQWSLGDPWAAGTTDDGATIVGRGTQGERRPLMMITRSLPAPRLTLPAP